MKTIIKEVKVYQFDELTEEAKQKVLDKLVSINIQFDWREGIYYDAKQIGLQIESFDLDRNRHATGSFLLSACEVAANIFKEHGEDCETYKTASIFMNDWQPLFNDYMDEESENYESRDIELNNDIKNLQKLLKDYAK